MGHPPLVKTALVTSRRLATVVSLRREYSSTEKTERACHPPNKHWDPKNWRQLKPGETPQPGDIGAYPLGPHPTDPNNYTGHSGVFTDQGAMAAHDIGVYVVPDQFAPWIPGIVYRRYIGD